MKECRWNSETVYTGATQRGALGHLHSSYFTTVTLSISQLRDDASFPTGTLSSSEQTQS